MTENLFNTWHPFEFSPTNLLENIPKLKRLTVENDLQKERLQKEKIASRFQNLKYLNEHLEIRAVLREFMQELITELPDDSEIPAFCNKLFGQCKVHLQTKILKHVRDLEEQRRQKLFPHTRKSIPSSSSSIRDSSTATTSGLFASSSGSRDLICDCVSESINSSTTSSCVCSVVKSVEDCCECTIAYESGHSCLCHMDSSDNCNTDEISRRTSLEENEYGIEIEYSTEERGNEKE